MRRLLWLLMVGCSSTSNSTPAEPAETSDLACSDEPLSSSQQCPPSYLPATDGPEQLCRHSYDAGFNVGSAQGYVFVGNAQADGYTECFYDPSSGALVGAFWSAAPNYSCIGIVPDLDSADIATFQRVSCADSGATAP